MGQIGILKWLSTKHLYQWSNLVLWKDLVSTANILIVKDVPVSIATVRCCATMLTTFIKGYDHIFGSVVPLSKQNGITSEVVGPYLLLKYSRFVLNYIMPIYITPHRTSQLRSTNHASNNIVTIMIIIIIKLSSHIWSIQPCVHASSN